MGKLFVSAVLATSVTWLPLQALALQVPSDNIAQVVKIVCGYTVHETPIPHALGSGVIIANNTVLTNAHVALRAEAPYDWCVGGITIDATIEPDVTILLYPTTAASDGSNQLDYVFLRAYNTDGTPATFSSFVQIADTSELAMNDTVTILGFPLIKGAAITQTEGVITSAWPPWIMSDAEAHPGNSGGGAFNDKGNLIGIPTMVDLSSDTVFIQDIEAILLDAFSDTRDLPDEIPAASPITPEITAEDAVALSVELTPLQVQDH